MTDEEKAAKKEIAQRFLDLLKESEDPATASFTDLRKELNDQLNAENTADSTDSADSSDESSSSSDASDTKRIRRFKREHIEQFRQRFLL